MAGNLNQFNRALSAIQTAMTNGFTDAGNPFWGTTGTGTLQVRDFDTALKGFSVEINKKNLQGNNWLAPYVYIHPFSTDKFSFTGSYRRAHTIEVRLIFTQQHYLTVDGRDISEDELARYYSDVLIDGFAHLSGRTLNGLGIHLEELPGTSQTGIMDDSNIYGVVMRYRVTF